MMMLNKRGSTKWMCDECGEYFYMGSCFQPKQITHHNGHVCRKYTGIVYPLAVDFPWVVERIKAELDDEYGGIIVFGVEAPA